MEKFLTKHKFSFDFITDVEYKLFEKNKITGYPITFILDKDGILQYVIGKLNPENVDTIKKPLSEY